MIDTVRRLKWFLRYQSLSWRRLLLPMRVHQIDPERAFVHYRHPSDACRCEDVLGSASATEHLPECAWGKIICRHCRGTGHCPECGGSGEDPTLGVADPDRDLATSAEHPGVAAGGDLVTRTAYAFDPMRAMQPASACRECGGMLLFSAREQGDGLCGSCSREKLRRAHAGHCVFSQRHEDDEHCRVCGERESRHCEICAIAVASG